LNQRERTEEKEREGEKRRETDRMSTRFITTHSMYIDQFGQTFFDRSKRKTTKIFTRKKEEKQQKKKKI